MAGLWDLSVCARALVSGWPMSGRQTTGEEASMTRGDAGDTGDTHQSEGLGNRGWGTRETTVNRDEEEKGFRQGCARVRRGEAGRRGGAASRGNCAPWGVSWRTAVPSRDLPPATRLRAPGTPGKGDHVSMRYGAIWGKAGERAHPHMRPATRRLSHSDLANGPARLALCSVASPRAN